MKILAVSLIVCSVASPALAGSVAGTGGATEITQLANNVELIDIAAQATQQVQYLFRQLQALQQQLQYAEQNLVSAPMQVWGAAQADLTTLANLSSQANAVMYAGGAIAQRFQQLYPGYQGTAPTGAQYATLVTNSLDAQKAAIQNAGLQYTQMGTERSVVQQIQGMSSSSPGALQAIQAGNMLTSQLIDQMQKTRLLLADQTVAQANAAAAAAQDKTNAQASVNAFGAPYVPNTTANQGDVGGLSGAQ
ncbi:MAG: hypothetical protein F8N15_05455 [Methanobacterium sp.]|nr:hypothetical protein [Methanobacterium sp.]